MTQPLGEYDISPEAAEAALRDAVGKTVPLVIYTDGVRKEIGTSLIQKDENGFYVEASMGSDIGDEVLGMLFGEQKMNVYSFGPVLYPPEHLEFKEKFAAKLSDKVRAELQRMDDTSKKED